MPRPKKKRTVEELEALLAAEKEKSAKHYAYRKDYQALVRERMEIDWQDFKNLPNPDVLVDKLVDIVKTNPIVRDKIIESQKKTREDHHRIHQRRGMSYDANPVCIVDVVEKDVLIKEFLWQNIDAISTYTNIYANFVNRHLYTVCSSCGVTIQNRHHVPDDHRVSVAAVERFMRILRTKHEHDLLVVISDLRVYLGFVNESFVDVLNMTMSDLNKEYLEKVEKILW